MTSTVDARDRLTTEDSTINTKHAGYTYDTNGSTLTKTSNGTTDSYTYDQLNRLVSATVGGAASSYVYDHQGQRVAVTTNGTTVHHHHDPKNKTGYTKPIEEKATASSAPTRSYLFGKDLIAQKDADSEEHLVADGHGTTRVVTNATGTVLESYNFDAFGNPVGFSAATALTTHLTTDGTYTPALGTHWHGGSNSGRYSDRAVGRWLSRDSFFGHAEAPLSQHGYLFVHHDPVNGIDPTGMFFSIGEMNVTQAIGNAVQSLRLTGAKLAWRVARNVVYRAIIGGAIGGWDAYLGGGDVNEVWDGIEGGAQGGAFFGALSSVHALQGILAVVGVSLGTEATIDSFMRGNYSQGTFRALTTSLGAFSLRYFKTIEGEMLQPRSMTSAQARQWYLKQLDKIPSMVDQSKPWFHKATEAFMLRYLAVVRARGLMRNEHDRQSLPPPKTLSGLIARQKEKGLEGDQAWEAIY